MNKQTEFRIGFSLPTEAMTKKEMAKLLDSYIAQLREAKRAILSGEGKSIMVTLSRTRKRPLGPEGRRKIADAQRNRWEKVKKAMGT